MLAQRTLARPACGRRTAVRVQAAAWTKVATKSEVAAAEGGRKVVEVGGQRVRRSGALLLDSCSTICFLGLCTMIVQHSDKPIIFPAGCCCHRMPA
jgi:hypothetical protein